MSLADKCVRLSRYCAAGIDAPIYRASSSSFWENSVSVTRHDENRNHEFLQNLLLLSGLPL